MTGIIDYLLLDRLKLPIPLTILLSAGLGLLLLRERPRRIHPASVSRDDRKERGMKGTDTREE